jgi:hypothetical protein
MIQIDLPQWMKLRFIILTQGQNANDGEQLQDTIENRYLENFVQLPQQEKLWQMFVQILNKVLLIGRRYMGVFNVRCFIKEKRTENQDNSCQNPTPLLVRSIPVGLLCIAKIKRIPLWYFLR